MTTSGTTNFNPALGDIVIFAFGLIGIRPAALLQEHLTSARMASNMLLGRWSSQGVNLWKVDLVTVPLVQGTATYSVDPSTITMLDAYITVGTGTAATNRIVTSISRTEYASYPNPQTAGAPTVFWFDRLLSPNVTLWPVPDGNEVSLSYYRLVQSQDANFTSGQTVEIPVYFIEAFAFGLAARLAQTWAPSLAAGLKAQADESYGIASRANEETANIYITPMMGSYFS